MTYCELGWCLTHTAWMWALSRLWLYRFLCLVSIVFIQLQEAILNSWVNFGADLRDT